MAGKTKIDENESCCPTVKRAERGAVVFGGADYFRAVREAVRAAKKSVRILGWDFHSKVRMLRGEEDGYPEKLGEFLYAMLDEKPELEIHILIWDFSMIYAAEREWRMVLGFKETQHPRLHFQTDDQLPLGCSHHQKVVVVDGKLGFVGGMDLAAWRWDESEHAAEDDRRKDPKGKTYAPYHDLQLAVTGEAAQELGRIFAQRWERATGRTMEPDDGSEEAVWPESLEVDFRDTDIGFARTYAAFQNFPEVREVEDLHLRIIGKAECYLYIENQYFSSHRMAQALCERLKEEQGPEVVLVLLHDIGTWMEESTMGVVRDRLLGLVREADLHGHLRVVYPVARGESGEEVRVYVHAKLIIADGRVVKIGSSNLTNRSMRVDSELDVVIEEKEERIFVTQLLHRLLAMHHSMEADEVAEVAGQTEGLIKLVDALRREEKNSLVPAPVKQQAELQRQLADSKLLDPEEPIDPGYWMRSRTPEQDRLSVKKRVLVTTLAILGLVGLAFLFKEGPGKLVGQEEATEHFQAIKDSPWLPLILTGLFIVASIVGISLNVLLVAAALILNPWIVFVSALVGAQIGANAGFFIGRLWGRKLLERFASQKALSLSQKLGERGVLSVAFLRLLPIAPFPMVNLAAGSSHLGARVFNLGSLLGMAPGMLGVVLLADVTRKVVRQPDAWNLTWFVVLTAAFVGAVVFVRNSLRERGLGKEVD